MLVLFDVDATLITTSRAGIAAIGDAGRELHGPGFSTDRTDFAGRLDPLIIHDVLMHNGIEPTRDSHQAMRDGYRRHLIRRLETPGAGRTLPGVTALLDALFTRPGVTIGLLTGNFPETGKIKLRACGIDVDRFHLAVWGDECESVPPRREGLPPVAIRRHAARLGVPSEGVDPASVVIIGDTPHDVACARANGCRCLAVATGSYTVEQLRAAGAHLTVASLGETTEVLEWLIPN